jgi:hypothetical protein
MIGDKIGIADVSECFSRSVEYESVDHCGAWSFVICHLSFVIGQ